ncbi:phosphopantetheine-binding protein [Chromobacterium piscinae]|uniref:Acyl carrier protein n=4 Tax=Chromobacterium piscinae TaxID=686831 RepID=A0ABV0H442_9NEIS|nr:acyl carrier protein [Chromobacterium vaccinii]NHQ82123.1 acyl carrier protein [Chromobacterium vaccinii]
MEQLKKRTGYDIFLEQILFIVKKTLNKESQTLYLDSPLSQFGLDSIMVTNIVSMINNFFKLKLSPVTVYGHKNVRDVASDLYDRFRIEIDTARISLQSIKSAYENVSDYPIVVSDVFADRPRLIFFSASDNGQLKKILHGVVDFLNNSSDDPNLIKALEFEFISLCRPGKARLAIIANDRKELLEEINYFIAEQSSNYIYAENLNEVVSNIDIFSSCNNAKKFLRDSICDNGLKKIAGLWSLGVDIDWHMVLGESRHVDNKTGIMEKLTCLI